jgi:sortase A
MRAEEITRMQRIEKKPIFEQSIRLKTLISLVIFIFAIFFLFDGFYIKAKAQYAQYLIADSWSHYMNTGEKNRGHGLIRILSLS